MFQKQENETYVKKGREYSDDMTSEYEPKSYLILEAKDYTKSDAEVGREAFPINTKTALRFLDAIKDLVSFYDNQGKIEEIIDVLHYWQEEYRYLDAEQMKQGIKFAANHGRGAGRENKVNKYVQQIAWNWERYTEGREHYEEDTWMAPWNEAVYDEELSRSSLYRIRRKLEEEHGLKLEPVHGNSENPFEEPELVEVR